MSVDQRKGNRQGQNSGRMHIGLIEEEKEGQLEQDESGDVRVSDESDQLPDDPSDDDDEDDEEVEEFKVK